MWDEEEEAAEGGGGCHTGGRRQRSLTSFFAPLSTMTTVIVVAVVVVVVIVVMLCMLDNVSRMYPRRVVDATWLEREHPWRGGDEGKRGLRRAWEGRERNNLLRPRGALSLLVKLQERMVASPHRLL